MRSIPQYLLKTNPAKPIIQYQFWFWCMSSDYQPDYQFVYMRYPNSFRATLTQIANGKKNTSVNLLSIDRY